MVHSTWYASNYAATKASEARGAEVFRVTIMIHDPEGRGNESVEAVSARAHCDPPYFDITSSAQGSCTQVSSFTFISSLVFTLSSTLVFGEQK